MATPNARSCSSLQDDFDARRPPLAYPVVLTLDSAASCLRSAMASYTRRAVAAPDDAESSLEAAKEMAALSVIGHMQRLSLVYIAAQTPAARIAGASNGTMHACVEEWVAWLEGLSAQSIALASKVAVSLASLQACWGGAYAVGDAERPHIYRIKEAIGRFFARAARQCVAEWKTYGIPLRTFLPPLALLTTYARFRWAWSRFAELTHVGDDGSVSMTETRTALTTSSAATQWRGIEDVDFVGVTCEVESCHAEKLVREVLLHAFQVIDWRAGNAVPTVKGVAPLVWCLFLRCRSYALCGQSEKCSPYDFFAHVASARLIAVILRCTVDGVCLCLEKELPRMHVARAEQVCTCDIPCLVLLTRLWFSWISLAPDAASVLLRPLECSLRRLVTSAVKLRGVTEEATPLSNMASELGRRGDDASRAEQEARFIEVVWKVTPLTMSEIASSTAATPWSAAFARAREVQAVLDKRTAVTPIP
ncbi:hypothetical protein LSCM1_02356 [Leishmania martiniquensis]|uniref:Uncharacterized protein n=1 Tax=Leishmania martiniquensis TaxID=1580590 RepID=A0A836G5G3_9TRYP|nr:hypothetical protein LSCM1_02356 [Leishmania martiniquensis]